MTKHLTLVAKFLNLKQIVVVATAMLAACAFNQQPYITYENQAHPLSDTAVFMSFGTGSLVQITHVDGVKTDCAQVGCPVWVRVLPGEHTFKIEAKASTLDGQFIRTFTSQFELKLSTMQPRHVYSLRRSPTGFEVDDRGENPDVGITLGLKGVNQKEYKVQF